MRRSRGMSKSGLRKTGSRGAKIRTPMAGTRIKGGRKR